MNNTSLVVQAGGESRRMGRDKGLVHFRGQPLIQRVVERLRPLAAEILVTTNHPEEYVFLGIPLTPDVLPGRGALGGLYTALKVARRPFVAVVACDMPFASLALLAYQRDLLASSAYDLAVPQTEYGTEPFHAVYRRDVCLSLVSAALEQGKWRAEGWFSQADPRFLLPEEIRRFDPHGLAFYNINTPEELAGAEALAAQGF